MDVAFRQHAENKAGADARFFDAQEKLRGPGRSPRRSLQPGDEEGPARTSRTGATTTPRARCGIESAPGGRATAVERPERARYRRPTALEFPNRWASEGAS